jgi:hypothetical protein
MMSVSKNTKILISATVGFVLVIVLIVVWAYFGKPTDVSETHSAQPSPEGFTFFDLGLSSELTENIRDGLRNKLGSDAIERRGTLDLEINYKGFLKRYFNDLNELNSRLNFPPRERVEHNIIKLMYRYAQRKEVPFKYVELVFADGTKKPLVFKIVSKKEGAIIIDTIKGKYGQHKTIQWEEEKGRSLYWQKHKSYFIISIRPDRYGNPEYHTVIYFIPNIEDLLLSEEREARQRAEEIKKKGKTAF